VEAHWAIDRAVFDKHFVFHQRFVLPILPAALPNVERVPVLRLNLHNLVSVQACIEPRPVLLCFFGFGILFHGSSDPHQSLGTN
jgi:hypothetical protein